MPQNLEPKDFETLGEWEDYVAARRVWRRSSIIEETGWTFTELDEQPRSEVADHLSYLNIKSLLLSEKRRIEASRAGR